MNTARSISAYVLSKSEDKRLHWQKLVKLLFLIDVAACSHDLVGEGETLTGLSYLAEENGPVPSGIEELLQGFASAGDFSRDGEYIVFTPSDDRSPNLDLNESREMVVKQTIHRFGIASWRELSEITHELPAWLLTERGNLIQPELLRYPYRFGRPELLS
ncbi:MAG: SocA family protein [Armatimonadetes bacterium]|nr:SocA family protein [Armatimonadota bacterium]